MMRDFILKLKAAGWTQEQIADKVGVRQNQISMLLKGVDPKVSTLKKFMDAFELSADEILFPVKSTRPQRSNSASENLTI